MLNSTLPQRTRHSFNICLRPLPAIHRPIYPPILITTPKRKMEVSFDRERIVHCGTVHTKKAKTYKYVYNSSTIESIPVDKNIFLPELSNAIRGYPLDGCKFSVPESFHGVVFQEMNRPLEENAERTFKVNGVFKDFTYWNYNREPSENDQLKQALQWNDFANAVSLSWC